MKNFCIFLITAALSVLASCKGGSTAAFSDLDTIPLRYAKLLTLLQGDGYVVAEVKNPWGDGLLARYTIDKPLTHSVFYTSSHVSLVDELGGYDVIKGVCDLDYMYLDKVHKDVAEGKIKDCGLSMTPDLEKIMELNPDAILLSPFENSGTYGKLGKLGIPIIECADYMENTALGRAEWVKFYGLLIGKAAEADSLFAEVERDYNKVKDISHLSPLTSHLSCVTEKKYGSTWYVAGNESTIAGLIRDAGGDYVFKDVESSGAVAYSPEVVFNRAQDADIWMFKYNQATDITAQQLAKEWDAYSRMKAFRTGRVYHCNLSLVPYYEETPFHPNLLLRDYVKILHPELLPDYEMRYYKPLSK